MEINLWENYSLEEVILTTITEEELGNRISVARREAAISQGELARLAGIERTALSRIEAGKRGVDSLELFRIAEALGKDFTYFVEPRTELSVRFRSEAKANPKASACLEKIQQLIGHYSFLLNLWHGEERGEYAGEAWPTFAGHAIVQASQAANFVRTQLGLGNGAIDIFHFLQDRADILFVRLPLGEHSIDGCYASSDETAVIAINSDQPESRQRFTAAHEFAHHLFDRNRALVIDQNVLDSTDSQLEKRASAFAANFLAPVDGVAKFIGPSKRITPENFAHLQWHFGLSYEATLWRLVDAGYFSRQRVNEWKNSYSNRTLAYRYGYWRQLEAEAKERGQTFLPSRFEKLAIWAYENGKVTSGRLAEMLWQEDVDDFLQKLDAVDIRAPEITLEDIKREERVD